ncbi:MAG TPA: class I SAM-dependent methyltransferase [Gaiellaceae bacterium]|nr:class I SAM-dependent methyltransferase [Gaiellaceae bacterium]
MIDARRFARFVTDVVVRQPLLWRVLRRPLRAMFDGIAPTWETRIGPHHLGALELALAEIDPPRRALDLGTGTGVAAKAVATRFPQAEVDGLDLSAAMIAEAQAGLPEELRGRVRFRTGDASSLPFADGEAELVTLMNMIPFFDELARVLAPGGHVVVSFSRGAETPIYVPAERLRRELERRGFAEFADFSAGPATAFRARLGRVPGNGSSRHGRTGPDA